jgi:hypothetical protein
MRPWQVVEALIFMSPGMDGAVLSLPISDIQKGQLLHVPITIHAGE